MPAEVTVATDPLIVYGMVGLLIGALVLALVFSRPRRGLGAAKPSDVPQGAPTASHGCPVATCSAETASFRLRRPRAPLRRPPHSQ